MRRLAAVLSGIPLFLAIHCKPWGMIPVGVSIASLATVLLFAALCFLRAKQRLESVRSAFSALGNAALIAFLASAVLSGTVWIGLAFRMLPEEWKPWLLGVGVCVLLEAVVFWFGILTVYATSVQLGIGLRILGVAFGMIPVANLIVLILLIHTVDRELKVKAEKNAVNRARADLRVCATRYPILLVHGVFFRDSRYFNYWGRIPAELERNGAKIYYGNHQSALSVADSGEEIAARIREIIEETGCEKLHVIAHSKGGLDCRWALAHCNVAPYVASLTTINTPHRGCEFADYLLARAPEKMRNGVAAAYRRTLLCFGEENPDFLAAVGDLTAERCRVLDAEMPLPDDVICQSVGSVLSKATGGQFPLNFSYHLVKYFDGPNDGLVGESSLRWGNRYILLTTTAKRGISHGDVIDLNRKDLPDFDAREFYVQLVSELRENGG